MKSRLTAVVLSTCLLAGSAFAAGVDTVLTSDSTLYSVETSTARLALELTRYKGEVRDTVLVPTTGDAAFESDARLAYDSISGTLYVIWHRSDKATDEIRIASLNAKGEWSQPLLVTSGAGARRAGLQLLLSRPQVEKDAAPVALLHAVWWNVGIEDVLAEYALVAFEAGQHASTVVASLDSLANLRNGAESDPEDTGEALHPPLALARAGSGVDIVYGKEHSTALTRVQVEPRRVSGNARMWKPVGRGSAQHTGPAKLVTSNSNPVQAFLSSDRIVLYTPEAKFRFMVFENNRWTPIRMIELDEQLSSEQMLEQLRRSVDENAVTAAPNAQE